MTRIALIALTGLYSSIGLMGLFALASPTVAAQGLVFERAKAPWGTTLQALPRSAVGDLTGDGFDDAVVGWVGPPGAIHVLKNKGTGAFYSSTKIADETVRQMRLADLDGDGALDLVTANGSVRVRLGAGDGSFGEPQVVFDHFGETRGVHVADATGDGVPDLIATSGDINPTSHKHLDILPGLGNGGFGAPIFTDDTGLYIFPTVDVGDVNGDTIPDLLLTGANAIFAAGHVRLYLGTGNGGFAPPVVISGLPGPADARLADLDGDGLLDIVLSGTLGLAVKPGNGDGSFGPAGHVSDHAFDSPLVLADFDDDGQLDVASVDAQTSELVLWRGEGDGTLVERVRVSSFPGSSEAWAGEFDGDGRTDIGRASTLQDPLHARRFEVVHNRTYAAGGPWSDLGQSLAESQDGVVHRPILWAEGPLQPGSQLAVHLARNEVKTSRAWLVLGFSSLAAPFHGGLMVPQPDLLVGPVFPALLFPDLTLSGALPLAMPAGESLWIQAWFVPQGAATEYAATTAVVGVTQ
jgi:hypothetical protein